MELAFPKPKPLQRQRRRETRSKKQQIAYPKPQRQRSKAFLRFVRTKHCAACNTRDSEAHHLDTKGSGGSDFSAVPLCHVCHMEWHDLGDAAFGLRWNINLWRTNSHLLTEYFTR